MITGIQAAFFLKSQMKLAESWGFGPVSTDTQLSKPLIEML